MICTAAVSQTATGDPKIKPRTFDGVSGAEITFELYNTSIDKLLELCEKELKITIERK